MSLFIYVELIFNKGTRPSKGERIVSSINGAGTIEYPHAKRMRQDPYLTPLTNIHSKWIKDLNVRAKTIKLLEGNISINFCDLGLGHDFIDMTPKEQATQKMR